MSRTPTADERIAIAHEPEGELARRFAEVIAADPALEAELADMRRTLFALRSEPQPATQLESARARSRFLLGTLSPGRPLERHLPRLAAAFGLLMLLAMLGVWFWQPSGTGDSSEETGTYLALRPARADAEPLRARIQAMQGDIAWRVADSEPRTLTPDLAIESGIAINQDPGASLFTTLRPGLTALINEATLTFVRLDSKDVILDLLRGSVALKVAALAPDQTVIVRTPEVAVSVTGTDFAVAYSPETGNVIAVREGRVAVTPHRRPQSLVTVEAGHVLLMDASLTAIKATLKEPDKTDRYFSPPEAHDWSKPLPGQQVQHRVSDNPGATVVSGQPAPSPALPRETADRPDTAHELLAQARQAQANRRFDEALGHLDELLTRHPKSPEAEDGHYLKAENLIGLGQVAEALNALDAVEARVTREDLRQAALYTRGHLLQERVKDLEGARGAWSQYLTRYPEGMLLEDAMFGLCANRSLAGDVSGTLERCSAFIKRFGRSAMTPQALILAADAAWGSQDYTHASLYYGLYATTDRPEHRVQALLRQAESLIRLDRPGRARTVLDKFLSEYEAHPRAPEARRMLENLNP